MGTAEEAACLLYGTRNGKLPKAAPFMPSVHAHSNCGVEWRSMAWTIATNSASSDPAVKEGSLHHAAGSGNGFKLGFGDSERCLMAQPMTSEIIIPREW